ncbi:MAG: NAD(P)-dependent oxidoreductase [Acidocella sp.]|nr:NAD(P)-dependent oxidoreductase [Acidocella sp.]
MIPIALDPKYARVAVAGNGPLALRRLRALRVAGADEALLFADAPIPELLAEAGLYRLPELPNDADLAHLHVLWIVDVTAQAAQDLAERARALRVLVNFEDTPAFCDFHSVAEVRRGDLLLTVSTNGAAPGLAGAIRRNLEGCFAQEWAGRVAEIAALREGWRAEGLGMPEAAKRINALVDERGWLACPKSK